MQKYLETYLALAGEDDWDAPGVPAHVEREFSRYLACGILVFGLACDYVHAMACPAFDFGAVGERVPRG